MFQLNFIRFTINGFPDSSVGKESTCNAGDPGLIPGLGKSPWEGKGHPLQYSGLENSTHSIVHGVPKSWTWLSDFFFTSLHKWLKNFFFRFIHKCIHTFLWCFIVSNFHSWKCFLIPYGFFIELNFFELCSSISSHMLVFLYISFSLTCFHCDSNYLKFIDIWFMTQYMFPFTNVLWLVGKICMNIEMVKFLYQPDRLWDAQTK